jgi:DNA-binding GntR family transcriptional regulator
MLDYQFGDADEGLRGARRSLLVDEAYRSIRAAITSGRLKPGAKLVVRPLAEALDLSPTPIKSALIALEREGFITSVSHRGFYVSEISAADMQEIYEIREVLEGIAAGKAAGHERHEELAARLTEILEAQFERVAAGDTASYSDLDLEFHHLIWTFSSNRRLVQAAENLMAQVRFGSGNSARLPGRLPRALDEHVAIVAAIKSGDAAAAASESRRHVRLAGRAFAERDSAAHPAPDGFGGGPGPPARDEGAPGVVPAPRTPDVPS